MQQEDLFPICLEEDNLLMQGQNPSLQGKVATAQPGGLIIRQLPGLTPMVTNVMMPLPIGKLTKESLPAMVETVVLYSTLVYRDVVTGSVTS